ncbi:MAG: ribose 5-phosphate isomerase B [Ignavibacteria bacterium]|jgi:ribose 5-phosphate isomerase B|nr:ribose 5-phosphate isomerase B [Ignavibacteria bacterium]HRI30014.1 ribose 5-phosphate isomerase B [Candidatus Kapabacteria bacterium]
MRIAIGADHAGYELKNLLADFLIQQGHNVIDCGTNSLESTDYPDYAVAACQLIENMECDYAVLVCGSGIGVCITANKVKGIRAANCLSKEHASLSRQHNNCNVVTLGARFLSYDEAKEIVTTFLSTEFEGGRHQKRVDKIHSLTHC